MPDSQHHLQSERGSAEEQPSEEVALALKKSKDGDVRKGQAVKRQLSLWDKLLDMRIQLQKSMVASNRLPPPSFIGTFLQAPECYNAAINLLNESSGLASELYQFQENLLTANDIIIAPQRKRRKLDSSTDFDSHIESFVSATGDEATLEESLHPYMLQTLSKWSNKVQAVAPSAFLPLNRGAFLKGHKHLQSAVQLVDESLSDKTKLIERTRVVRVKKERIARPLQLEPESELPDPEIFDDTDFYQKLLQSVIDLRGSGARDEGWQLLQKQKREKKKTDPKASKGRKLRFEIHEKMQNFMVPVPVAGSWHDDQKDELFSSLLGKGFESAVLDEPQRLQNRPELSGFRVFG